MVIDNMSVEYLLCPLKFSIVDLKQDLKQSYLLCFIFCNNNFREFLKTQIFKNPQKFVNQNSGKLSLQKIPAKKYFTDILQ
jgi:hypothetical protein